MLKHFLFYLGIFFAAFAHAQEPLEPTQAFRFSAHAIDAQTIEARWQIVDGYYMYRDKFKFTLDGATLGEVVLPAGILKDDDLFGKVETYRKDLRILLPVSAPTWPVVVKAV